MSAVKLLAQSALTVVSALVFFAVVLFWPAGTWHWWQGWAFVAVFAVTTVVPSIVLAVRHPDTLARRMHAGPRAETRPVQRVASTAVFVLAAATMALGGLDHRLGWSSVPVFVVAAGEALVAAGLVFTQAVVFQNRYAAANIVVEDGQTVCRTGLYALVRHPMYLGALTMSLGVPLALGSYWALLAVLATLIALVARILDEEVLLRAELPGYHEYAGQVRYRLLPGIW